jgi:4-hydroxythreonine-4-phosphate dehydrogenase
MATQSRGHVTQDRSLFIPHPSTLIPPYDSHMNPRLLLTQGDVAGIGPEIIAKAWPELVAFCHPIVIGDPEHQRRAAGDLLIQSIRSIDDAEPDAHTIPCLKATDVDLGSVELGKISGPAGRAAYDFLVAAIDLTMAGRADGIVTAPLQKEGLHAGGLDYPGHTEILAERTGTRNFAMMLWARGPLVPHGLGVVHVTLHMALRDVFAKITTSAIREKIDLLAGVMRQLKDGPSRLVVAALNPHASDGGLFGNEEETIVAPAVKAARETGIDVVGPLPSDTLFVRAQRGDFDGIVALYHDQGHIPLKLLSGLNAVNISVGLPIVRTSVAHGTAYDIAGKGIADQRSMIEATRVAAKLIRARKKA